MIDATKWPKEALEEHERLVRILDGMKPVLEAIVRSADHLSKATPDKVLRSGLERAVKLGLAHLKTLSVAPQGPVNVPTASVAEALVVHSRTMQEMEQALYRTALREDVAKQEANNAMAAVERIAMEFITAVEKAAHASPMNRQEALTYIAVLGRERDEAREHLATKVAEAGNAALEEAALIFGERPEYAVARGQVARELRGMKVSK